MAYSGSMPCWLVLRPCWAALWFNFCIVFWFCLFLWSVLLTLLVVGIGHSSCLCPIMPCWWDMPLLGGNTALGRRQVITNWMLPPSGRMRLRVVGVNSGRPHTGIAVGIPVFMRLSDRLRSDVVFPVDIWCIFEYVDVSEAFLFEMLSFIILGFRFYVLPHVFSPPFLIK